MKTKQGGKGVSVCLTQRENADAFGGPDRPTPVLQEAGRLGGIETPQFVSTGDS